MPSEIVTHSTGFGVVEYLLILCGGCFLLILGLSLLWALLDKWLD